MINLNTYGESGNAVEIAFVEFSIEFLNLSWIWLNDPEIRKLTNTKIFTREVQLSWFQNLKHDTQYKIWGIQLGFKKIGVMGLKSISLSGAEYFGYIGDKECWGKGISKVMLDHGCAYARTIKVEKIWLRVIKDNLRAIRAYQKYGFIIVSDEDDVLEMTFEIFDGNMHEGGVRNEINGFTL